MMRLVDEFRDPAAARHLVEAIHGTVTRPWSIMEVCGGQTHGIVRFGIDEMLPDGITLLHGPGCPVCVTPATLVDHAIAISRQPGATLATFGDMVRVPGSTTSLLEAKATGGDVRIVYSPLDAVDLARRERDRQVVFFAVGFETTAPATALAVRLAARDDLDNLSLLVAHVLVPPAMRAILGAPDNRVQAFLAAGHVCTVVGLGEYEPICRTWGTPVVATGFEPLDILQGVLMCVRQLEAGEARVENQYARAVRSDGNPTARAAVTEVFEPVTREWRGLGPIPASGLALRDAYAGFDAARRFAPAPEGVVAADVCRAGEVLRGALAPPDCPAFGTRCTPDHPLGPPMVSGEGACAAYHLHRGD